MTDKIFEILKKQLPAIKKNVALKNHATFKIGGPAKYFLQASKKEDILKASKFAKKYNIPFFILGGGSNLLVSDKGYDGLVLKIKSSGSTLKIKNNTIEASAGIELGKLVDFSVGHSLAGLEWAGGLPGTFGGAIRGNAGAFGGETKDSIIEVMALDSNLNLKKFNNQQCQFSYRSSVFKKKNWPVLFATITFAKGDKKKLKEIAASHVEYRKEKQPLDFPNAGSIFKNCDLSLFSEKLQQELAHVVKKDPFPVVPTAYLISEAGFKGLKIGDAQVSPKHPNFIINLGNAKAQDVLQLVQIVKEKIKKMYGVDLEMEVQYLGN